MSVHAVVLIQCETDEIPEAAQAIAGIDGVSEVYSQHDLERLFAIGFEES